MHIRMPQMDGIGLLQVLRVYLRWHRLPVIVVTSQADPEKMTRARVLGAYYIFHKASFQLTELGELIEAVHHPPDWVNDTNAC